MSPRDDASEAPEGRPLDQGWMLSRAAARLPRGIGGGPRRRKSSGRLQLTEHRRFRTARNRCGTSHASSSTSTT